MVAAAMGAAPVQVAAAQVAPVPAPVPAPAPDAVATAPAPRPAAARVAAPRLARPRVSSAATSGNSEIESALKQAHAALRGGNARLARGHATNALALDPTNAAAYIVLGAARSALGDASGAQQAYRLCAERATGPRAAACKALVR